MAVTALQFFSTDYKPQTIDYTQFQEYVEDDMVMSGVIIGRTFKGTFKEALTIESSHSNQIKEVTKFLPFGVSTIFISAPTFFKSLIKSKFL